ncbi:MAG: methylmalonyl Co-A mutase-associated GTPase MeaB [Solirubrobacterales bacterium]
MADRDAEGLAELEQGVLSGDRGALSRAITLAESTRPEDVTQAQALISDLLPKTGGSARVGLTGVPGAGKSTAIEALGLWLLERGKKVAVLTIDPSSARTGGSILGDKTRMQKLSASEDAFIRPSPSGGVLGGVARRTREAILLCEAAGYDVVLVESVGVGQSESEMADLVDTLCLLLVPGTGDELQGIKRGLMEVADVVVVNKADGDRVNAANRARGDFRQALHMLPPSTPGWETPVLTASALEGTGLAEIWDAVEGHREVLEGSGLLQERRARQGEVWLDSMIEDAAIEDFLAREGVTEAVQEARAAVASGEKTVPEAFLSVLDLADADS